jgi:hypothetical protein
VVDPRSAHRLPTAGAEGSATARRTSTSPTPSRLEGVGASCVWHLSYPIHRFENSIVCLISVISYSMKPSHCSHHDKASPDNITHNKVPRSGDARRCPALLLALGSPVNPHVPGLRDMFHVYFNHSLITLFLVDPSPKLRPQPLASDHSALQPTVHRFLSILAERLPAD